MQFQEKTMTGTAISAIAPAGQTFSFKSDDSLWVSRLVLNYRF